jgi:putative tricarboxylic transport membrane protein
MTDRIAAGVLIAVAAAYIVLATRIQATFFTDPLGPRWVPILIGVFVIGSCVALLLRPVTAAAWPDAPTWARLALCLVGFVAYALLLVPLGFIVATTLAYTLFAMLFHARFGRSLLAGAIFAVASYLLFSSALDLYLPTGRLFQGWF